MRNRKDKHKAKGAKLYACTVCERELYATHRDKHTLPVPHYFFSRTGKKDVRRVGCDGEWIEKT